MVQLTTEQRQKVTKKSKGVSGNAFQNEYVKGKVFVSPPAIIDDLKTRAFDVLKADRNRELVRRAVRDMIRRINLCIERDGGHVEGNLR